jgi:predicted transposase YdaD
MGIEQFLLQRAENKGIEKGIEKGIKKSIELDKIVMIEKFLLKSELSIDRIADFVEVSTDYVLNIKKRLEIENKLL